MVGFRWMLAVVAVAGLSVTGCGNKSDSSDSHTEAGGAEEHAGHDHAEHEHADPKNLPEAVGLLAEMRDELAAAYKEGNTKEADGVIHEMGDMAKTAEKMLTSSDLDRYAQKEAQTSIDQIIEVLSTLHEESHGAEAKIDPATYDGQQDAMNDAISNLQKKVEKPADE
ncbi:hypothetical protein NG895_29480 [Aeoliella sp. ICT_H6.2]|uniref:Uncharacterized protein n=1 Tax=Aeoliella straminimaris TaxID=2954799 RepID=A0A9X2FFU6_9BACT|nr:hypothetical protein [Aeoliella straminimaris]MCO6048054.1 hypothetical protein [Aeoliella straminimaris]